MPGGGGGGGASFGGGRGGGGGSVGSAASAAAASSPLTPRITHCASPRRRRHPRGGSDERDGILGGDDGQSAEKVRARGGRGLRGGERRLRAPQPRGAAPSPHGPPLRSSIGVRRRRGRASPHAPSHHPTPRRVRSSRSRRRRRHASGKSAARRRCARCARSGALRRRRAHAHARPPPHAPPALTRLVVVLILLQIVVRCEDVVDVKVQHDERGVADRRRPSSRSDGDSTAGNRSVRCAIRVPSRARGRRRATRPTAPTAASAALAWHRW